MATSYTKIVIAFLFLIQQRSEISMVLGLGNSRVKDFVSGLPGFGSSFVLTSCMTLAKLLNLSVADL